MGNRSGTFLHKSTNSKVYTLLLLIGFFWGSIACAESEETLKMYNDIAFAARKGNLEQVEALLQKGADPNWNKSHFGIVPLLHRPLDCRSLDANKVAIMKMLLEAGANPNGLSRRGDTALIKLGTCDNTVETLEIADLLISYKVDLKAKNKRGNTALSRAILHGNDPLSAFLAEYSDISEESIKLAMIKQLPLLLVHLIQNDLNYSEYSLMIWALRYEQDQVLIALLENGADPNKFFIENPHHIYPIIYAAHKLKNNAVKTLYHYGADLSVQGKKGRTVQNLIEKAGNTELNDWLKNLNND